jgi:hypothetical protein
LAENQSYSNTVIVEVKIDPARMDPSCSISLRRMPKKIWLRVGLSAGEGAGESLARTTAGNNGIPRSNFICLISQ